MSSIVRTTIPVKLAALLAVFASGLLPGAAVAQEGWPQNEMNASHPSHPYVPPSRQERPSAPRIRHASTVHEGVGRAVSHIMDAYANQMLSYAQARILIDEAIAREYQLRVVNVQTFLEKQHLRREAREADRLHRWEWEAQAEQRRQERQEKVLNVAYRLPASKLHPGTGEIAWPEALRQPEFTNFTCELDRLFEQLARHGAQYDRLFRDPIDDLCADFRDELMRSRSELGLDWDEYVECQKLIVGLRYGAQFWPGDEPTEADRRVASL